jgi:hypothetical protein
MISNTDGSDHQLNQMYDSLFDTTGDILKIALEAIREARRKRDLETLEISQEQENDRERENTRAASDNKEDISTKNLSIEQVITPSIEQTTGSPEKQSNILFGKSDDGFVNKLTPEQERAVGQMLMNKPGSTVPGAENLVIRYKGEIIASTNKEGILEANELYGKIPDETLQRLNDAITKTPYANAPVRKQSDPVAEITPVEPIKMDQTVGQIAVQVTPSTAPVQSAPAVDPNEIKRMGVVPPELRIPRPVKKTSVPSGNPVTQIESALSKVSEPGNGIMTIATELKSTTVNPAARTGTPDAIDPKKIVGIPAISTGKAAGLMGWIEANSKEGEPVISPKGYVGTITTDINQDKTYTLKDLQGDVVLNATAAKDSPIIQVDTYSSKGIGKEWEAIKKAMPQEPIQPVNQSTNQSMSVEDLTALKDITDKYVVKEGISKQVAGLDNDPNLLIGYEKLPNGKTEYSLYDKTDPYAKVSFKYDEADGKIQDIQQTTTPSMMSLVERANLHMKDENNQVKDAADRVNIAEDRQPGSQTAAPVVTTGKEIPLSSVPIPTTQSSVLTTSLSQQQIAMVSKSITITNAACEAQDAKTVELENTKVSIEDKDRNTKIYTLQDLETKQETRFSHDRTTGEIVIQKESEAATLSIDKDEKILAPVIPGYPEIVATTSKQIERGGEVTIPTKQKGEMTRSGSTSKTKAGR